MLEAETIGTELFSTLNSDAKVLKKGLDDGVNPPSKKAIDYSPIPLDRCGCELGTLAGALAVSVPRGQSALIGQDGATVISDNGAGFTPGAASVKGTAGLISDKSGGLIGNGNTSPLIGQDGATLIGQDGATFISDNGAGRIAPSEAGGRHRKAKSVIMRSAATSPMSPRAAISTSSSCRRRRGRS